MEVGCEGSVALDLMKRMTSAGSTPIAEPGTSSAPPTPAGTVEGEADNKKRKRSSAVKKQKQNGSQLEMIAEEDDPVAFLQAWVKASTDAQGVCTTVSAQQLGLCLINSLYPCMRAVFLCLCFAPRLEQLESQAALAQLLVDCSHHLGVARKELLNLGPRPAKDSVAQVLQSVSTWVVGYRKHVTTANALLQSHKREVLGKPKGKAKAKAKS